MATPNRCGPSPRSVEEKRRSLPIYDHYTLSPGKTKSHHPEAKCNHCLREFVCGSKQRLIRHIKKCNNITNSDQIVADTLNTLAQNSSTGHLNQSILEASDLLPSRYQRLQSSAKKTRNSNAGTSTSPSSSNNNSNNNTSASSNNASDNKNSEEINGSNIPNGTQSSTPSNITWNGANYLAAPRGKRSSTKKSKKNNQAAAVKGALHVTTGADGKAHFAPVSSLTNPQPGAVNVPIISSAQNRSGLAINCFPTSGRFSTGSHQGGTAKLNTDSIEKAYLKLVLTRNLPMTLCDTKEFQQWIKLFSDDYKPPSSITLITQNLKQEASNARNKVSNILVRAAKKTINLELHNWSDELRGHSWFAVIANFDQKRFLIALQDVFPETELKENETETSQFGDVKTNAGTNLIDLIDDCISKCGADRVNSLILNEDEVTNSSIGKARTALKTSHPSIIPYICSWNLSNLICSDIVNSNVAFMNLLKNVMKLINSINRMPKLRRKVPSFNPFIAVNGQPCPNNNDKFWYCHIVCYLLEYLKKSQTIITQAFQLLSISENNHGGHDGSSTGEATNNNNNIESQKKQPNQQENSMNSEMHINDSTFNELKSLITSANFWSELDSMLIYLKPIRDLLALTSTRVTLASTDAPSENGTTQLTSSSSPLISLTALNCLSMSDFMHWFLNYGKALFNNWTLNSDVFKQKLIESYLKRFLAIVPEIKLLFAAYILNPKYKCAYMTKYAQDQAIEEILNIASEFMPEESDGHAIYDQWKLYLKREEPYDMPFDESKSTPIEWWTSLPCAESIRRVALRILRLRAMSSHKPKALLSQLELFEDECGTLIESSSFEDAAVLKYLYNYEDRSLHCNQTATISGFTQVCCTSLNAPNSTGFLPGGDITMPLNFELSKSRNLTSNRTTTAAKMYGDEVDDVEMIAGIQPDSIQMLTDQFSGYALFKEYVDFSELGVEIVDEPPEKRRKKWTAQEILAKQTNNNENSKTAQGQTKNSVIVSMDQST